MFNETKVPHLGCFIRQTIHVCCVLNRKSFQFLFFFIHLVHSRSCHLAFTHYAPDVQIVNLFFRKSIISRSLKAVISFIISSHSRRFSTQTIKRRRRFTRTYIALDVVSFVRRHPIERQSYRRRHDTTVFSSDPTDRLIRARRPAGRPCTAIVCSDYRTSLGA